MTCLDVEVIVVQVREERVGDVGGLRPRLEEAMMAAWPVVEHDASFPTDTMYPGLMRFSEGAGLPVPSTV